MRQALGTAVTFVIETY